MKSGPANHDLTTFMIFMMLTYFFFFSSYRKSWQVLCQTTSMGSMTVTFNRSVREMA